jgi:4-carboxymuconolactone decarboxylase
MLKSITALMLVWNCLCFCGAALAQSGTFPPDIDPVSHSRLPIVTRDQLNADDQRVYDMVVGPNASGPMRGPGGISLHSPKVAEAMHLFNQYVRYQSVLGRRYIEVAILVAAREFDQQYEWTMHEPAALNAGVPQAVIDAIKYDRDVAGLGAEDSLIIRYGREIFRDHRLSPELWAEAVQRFGRQGAFEIAALMGDYVMAGVMLHAVDQRLPPDRPPLLPIEPATAP